jgi:predicted chitinase
MASKGITARWTVKLKFYEKSEALWKKRHTYRNDKVKEWEAISNKREANWRTMVKFRPEGDPQRVAAYGDWQAILPNIRHWRGLREQASNNLKQRRLEVDRAERVLARHGKKTIDVDAFRTVCPWISRSQAVAICAGLGAAFERYNINTPRRAAMAVAQMAHESAGFRTRQEYASGAAYEGRRDLGNTSPGDGVKFKGRGRIMITGKANYKTVTREFGRDFLKSPHLLATSPLSELASCWWWEANGCNGFADRNDFLGLTQRINGGFNGLEDRRQYYARAVKVANKLVPR